MSGVELDARVVVQRAGFRLDVELQAAPGEVVALMGPSGAGKSTLLGALAGLVGIDEGRIALAGRVLDAAPKPRARTTPARRRIVLLGQDPHLFPHMTAHTNIAFGRRVQGATPAVASGEADEWLWRVGLAGLGARRPAELSGGQQQRVALARALATAPSALLLDEPFASLDPETAGDIRALVHDQLVASHMTAIVATHDAVDAVALASRLVVLEGGRVTQSGPVRDVLAAPGTTFTATVAGLNRVVGEVRDGVFTVATRQGESVSVAASRVAPGPHAAIFRPSDVDLERVEADSWTGALRLPARTIPGEWLARVTRLEQTPAGVRVRTTEPDVSVDMPADRVAELALAPGQPIRLHLDGSAVRFVEVAEIPVQ